MFMSKVFCFHILTKNFFSSPLSFQRATNVRACGLGQRQLSIPHNSLSLAAPDQVHSTLSETLISRCSITCSPSTYQVQTRRKRRYRLGRRMHLKESQTVTLALPPQYGEINSAIGMICIWLCALPVRLLNARAK